MFFVYQIVKGNFPAAAAAYAPGCVYGSMANDNPAKGIVRVSDMLLIFFVFSHGKAPFLNNGRGRQHSLLSPSWLPTSKDRRGCQRWAQPIYLPLTGSAGFATSFFIIYKFKQVLNGHMKYFRNVHSQFKGRIISAAVSYTHLAANKIRITISWKIIPKRGLSFWKISL